MKHTPTRTLTLATIALLALTGCGAQATGSIPEADASATTSASASSTSGAADATASTAETNYSGESKAPDGEYRAADEHGPAQNVPKPVAPDGMNVETPEAMEKFITYWNDMRNYANQTGDVTDVRKLVDESFEQEQKFYDSLHAIYQADGWVIGGSQVVHYDKNLLVSQGNGEYSIGANFEVENSVLWVNGEARAYDNSQAIYEGVELKTKFSNGSWKIVSAKVVS
ncbi:DUF6318 family protein [Rothia nasimurium]|uniref:DUF6318 family protein n=1 Tax=Rothia nasimurium TaxID=85336 RepID=UPI001F2C9A78|nr:DUF6318 family protein [Rothia nasimurium]